MAARRRKRPPDRYSGRAVIRSDIDSEQNMARRQRARRRKKSRRGRVSRIRIIGIAALVLVLACVIGFATRKNGTDVLVDGTSVGVIDTRKITLDDLMKSTTALIAEKAGTNVEIINEITVEGVHMNKKMETMSVESMIAKLRDTLEYNVEAYAIEVNGEAVATLRNKEEADEVLSYLNSMYTPEGMENASISYMEDVQVTPHFVAADRLTDLETAKKTVALGESTRKTHKVVSGETLSSIAAKYGMTLNELLEMNPSLNVSTSIHVGDAIEVESTDPFITVKASVTVTSRETAEKEIEYRYDNTRSSSYKRIVQQGTAGVTEVTKEVVYINGVLDSENVIDSKVVTQPVKEIVTVGTAG